MNGEIVTDPDRPHLGGYRAGGDEATIYTALWDWLVKDFGVSSVIDVGCGDGQAVKYFRELLGSTAFVRGIDGIPQDDPAIQRHDYTLGPFPVGYYDLAWCCEVLEHIEEKFLPNILSTLACAKTILLTHAEPGQQGFHHVLCREPEYWRGALAGIGYRCDEDLTAQARAQAAKNKSPWNHFTRSGLAFVRN